MTTTADRALARIFGLPEPTTEYTVDRGLRVPMREGVGLVADHYRPADGTAVAGTVLVRGPYGRGFPASTLYARLYAAHGYHVLLQSVRGTSGSGGDFEPMTNEVSDGADTVEWLRRQPWFTGRFATLGASYLGFTQWALLMDPPEELAAAVIAAGPHDMSATVWDTGAFKLNDTLGWANLVAHQEEKSRLRALMRAAVARRRLAQATLGLPLGESARALLGSDGHWFDSWLKHQDPDHPYWEPSRLGAALDRATVPVLLIGGWQDLFLRQTMKQYQHLRDRGVEVALTVGEWTHAQMTVKGAPRVAQDTLDWLDRHLAGADRPARQPVRVRITGDDWVDLPDWPPPTSPRVFPLWPGGVLGNGEPPGDARPSSFTYDPTNPTPIVGGPLLSPEGGYQDDSTMARRADVLSFTGHVLPADLYVVGTPVVELWHAADIPHVDLFVRVSEVNARGASQNVSDGYQRVTATPSPDQIRIELDPMAHRFRRGSRIRVLVAGGAHPRFGRNLGTGEPTISAQRLVPAVHSVHHGEGGMSRLILPTTPGAPSADGTANPVGDSA